MNDIFFKNKQNSNFTVNLLLKYPVNMHLYSLNSTCSQIIMQHNQILPVSGRHTPIAAKFLYFSFNISESNNTYIHIYIYR